MKSKNKKYGFYFSIDGLHVLFFPDVSTISYFSSFINGKDLNIQFIICNSKGGYGIVFSNFFGLPITNNAFKTQ